MEPSAALLPAYPMPHVILYPHNLCDDVICYAGDTLRYTTTTHDENRENVRWDCCADGFPWRNRVKKWTEKHEHERPRRCRSCKYPIFPSVGGLLS